MSKRVLFVAGCFTSGGAEHQCAQLMGMLIDKGYKVDCVTIFDAEDHYDISKSVNRIRIAPNQPLWKKVLKLEWFLIRAKADVVIAFSQRLSVLALPAMLFRPSIKVISSDRNLTIGPPSRYEKILVKSQLWLRANYIVPNSYSQGEYLTKLSKAIGRRIHVITNYTDLTLYDYHPLPHNSIIRIGVFCRYEHQKNFHGFIDMLNVLKHRTDMKFCVEWYGNHSFNSEAQTHYYESCLRKIREYELDDILRVNGPTKNVASLIPTFDVMCLPSLKEGFSNSISEYICCGRPVLCSNVSDNSVMVHDGENGFLFDPNDTESMCQSFLKFFNLGNDALDGMSKKSRSIAESLFDKDVFVKKYIELIEHEE